MFLCFRGHRRLQRARLESSVWRDISKQSTVSNPRYAPSRTYLFLYHILFAGFPSTHTLSGVLPLTIYIDVLKFHLVSDKYSIVIYCGCLWYLLSIMASRLYLGVHSYVDILGGLIIAIAISVPLYFESVTDCLCKPLTLLCTLLYCYIF